jgi:hypothetical protein
VIVPTADFEHVRRRVEQNRGITRGNTRRLFHCTVRKCCLGDTSSKNALCRLSTCSLCRVIQVSSEHATDSLWYLVVSVLQSSFQLSKAGQRISFRRFGAGIYTTATSSKVSLLCVTGGERSPDIDRPMPTPLRARLHTNRCFSTRL